MKIKSIVSKNKNKLVELQILKSKIYKTLTKKKIENNKIKLYLKKVLHIIYEYHINNKTILFANFPLKLEKNLTEFKKNIKHIFISEKNWTSGLLTNKSVNMCHQLIQNSNNSKITLTNKKKVFDLLVIFNPTTNQIFSESYNLYIPTVLITESLFNTRVFLLKQSYKILGNFKFVEEQINNNFFLSMLKAIFKHSTVKKKTQIYRSINKKLLKKKKKLFYNKKFN